QHFVTTRQQFFIGPVHAKSVQANTVFVTGIPTRYLNLVALHAMFKDLPGGVKHVWVNRNLRTLPDIYDRRMPVTAEGSFSIQLTQVAVVARGCRFKMRPTKRCRLHDRTVLPRAGPESEPVLHAVGDSYDCFDRAHSVALTTLEAPAIGVMNSRGRFDPVCCSTAGSCSADISGSFCDCFNRLIMSLSGRNAPTYRESTPILD
ncbi:hypothetical protein DFH08DRAFT_1030920, partial [Mycena albidolilacea]